MIRHVRPIHTDPDFLVQLPCKTANPIGESVEMLHRPRQPFPGNATPAGVSRAPVGCRSKRTRPTAPSSCEIVRLTAGWESPMRLPVSEKFPVSARSRNTINPARSISMGLLFRSGTKRFLQIRIRMMLPHQRVKSVARPTGKKSTHSAGLSYPERSQGSRSPRVAICAWSTISPSVAPDFLIVSRSSSQTAAISLAQ